MHALHTLDHADRYEMIRAEQVARQVRSARAQLANAHASSTTRQQRRPATLRLRHRLVVATAAAILLLGGVASAWAGSNAPSAADTEPVPCVYTGGSWAC
jgi:anti-sigma factor RsiW